VANGNKCFLSYFTVGLKGAADHPKMRQARALACIEFVSFVSACEIYEVKDNKQI